MWSVSFNEANEKAPRFLGPQGFGKSGLFFRPYDPPVTATQLNGRTQHTGMAAPAAAWVIEA